MLDGATVWPRSMAQHNQSQTLAAHRAGLLREDMSPVQTADRHCVQGVITDRSHGQGLDSGRAPESPARDKAKGVFTGGYGSTRCWSSS